MVDQVFLSRTGYRKIDAIAGFVPYIGANQSVILGLFDITANRFHGPLTGNVTGNVSGSAGNVAAANITGTTLAAGVIASSLTSFGAGIALGTPASGIATNLTGTASGLTAGHVTTNANLTGPITSIGNATSVASQTGTGSTFVMNNSPILITPVLGVATGTSLILNGTISTDTGTNNWLLGSYTAGVLTQAGSVAITINGVTYNLLTS